MAKKTENPFAALERIIHEPNRLAIMSALCGEGADGMTFNKLKERCDLTDGNLSRHLKALADAGMIRIDKDFVDAKPRTTVFPTSGGLTRFIEYLDNLEAVLRTAATAAAARKRRGGEKARHFHGLAHRPAKA
jgi:DNA-binding transcriptional ArsR family regulator